MVFQYFFSVGIGIALGAAPVIMMAFFAYKRWLVPRIEGQGRGSLRRAK